MLYLPNSKASITLDSYLDIPNLLSLETEFYFLYANNLQHTTDVWNAAGIPIELKWPDWPYLTSHQSLYRTYHSTKETAEQRILDIIASFEEKNDRQGLAKFLQLKYGSFNPYRILHLSKYQKELHGWVPDIIKNWIKSLPFQSIDMVTIFFNDHYCPSKYHRDYNFFPIEQGNHSNIPDTVQDLIWFRFDINRGFNLFEIDSTGNILDTHKIQGHSAIFNHYNWHGSVEPYDIASLTMKIEGNFTSEFTSKIYA